MVNLEAGKSKNVKIIDLGLAKGVAEEDALSTVGAFIGTPAYASPEQFAGIGTDIRSDLYSLGVTLWEMLNGKVPFSGSAAELMYQHQHAEPPIERLSNLPAPVMALLQVLLAKDPNQRFQTPVELQKAIAKVRERVALGSELSAGGLRSAGDQTKEHLSKRRPGKHAVRLVFGAGLCVAAALIAWFLLFSPPGSMFNRQAAPAAPVEKSIAVLPFEEISANKDDTYFVDGVHDEILNNLAKIAQTIAGKLTATLSPDEKKRIEAKPTDNLEAYDLYLHALELIFNARLSTAIGAGLEAPMRDAISFLEQAVRLDPNFTLAYCAAAQAHGLLYRFHDPTLERRALGDAAIDHARRLQPDLPEVHLAYAMHLYLSYRDYQRARVQLAIAELPKCYRHPTTLLMVRRS